MGGGVSNRQDNSTRPVWHGIALHPNLETSFGRAGDVNGFGRPLLCWVLLYTPLRNTSPAWVIDNPIPTIAGVRPRIVGVIPRLLGVVPSLQGVIIY